MPQITYGALPHEWRQLINDKDLHHHILPICCAPESVVPSAPNSQAMKQSRGKVPSTVINGYAYGISRWPTIPLGGREFLEKCEKESLTEEGSWMGAFLRTGHNGVIAIDCDADDPDRSKRVLATLASMLGVPVLSVRTRNGSDRWLALIILTDSPAFKGKVVIKGPSIKLPDGTVKSQQVECMGAGAGVALFGTHPSGVRYEWACGEKKYPTTRKKFEEFLEVVFDIMTDGLDERQKDELYSSQNVPVWCATEDEVRGSAPPKITKEAIAQISEEDPTVSYLNAIGYPLKGYTPDGGIKLRCPNWKEHTTGDDEAVYYPLGHPRCAETGGFKCLHAHCADKSRQWFLNAVRSLPEYKDAPEPDPLCFITKPHEIRFEDETAASEAGAAAMVRQQEERIKRQEELDGLCITERDARGAEEKGKRRKDDLKTAREALHDFIRVPKKGEIDEENPKYSSSNLAIRCAMAHPVICGFDVRMDNYRRVITRRKYGQTKREPLRDVDYIGIMNSLEEHGFINPGKERVIDQTRLYADEMEYDDMVDFVKKCVPDWDGVPRIDTMFTEHFHAVLSEVQTPAYYAAAARYFMMALVKRAMTPKDPVKADDVLVFQGEQGCGKSTAVACFALRREDALEGLSFTDDAGEWAIRINGRIVAEVPEMNGYNKREISDIKFILSQSEDTYRPKYERTTVTRPRRCMIILTTNEPQSLTDPTGNRRFLVIEVARGERIDVQWLRENMFQIWAEAIYMLRQSDGYIPQREAEAAATQVTGIFVRSDPLEEDILAAAELRNKTSVKGVSIRDIIADIGSGTGLLPDMRGEKRVADILRNNGWGQVRVMSEQETRVRRWRKK